ncbi:MAG: metallophosphoesterase [Acidobacteria bacterium]|nr:metallophosphoesterase [Acidobacteriota bacterium]
MPRIVAISDTHSRHQQFMDLPAGDILIHAGDATVRGELEEITEFNRWLGTLPYKHKVFVAGNHDFLFERWPEVARAIMTNAHYLQDEFVMLDGLKIYGAPWQPRFFNWAFNVDRGPKIRRKWERIPDDTDVLITHGPPHGILDVVSDRWTGKAESVGCEELLPIVQQIKPRAHIFGHIHSSYGQITQHGTEFINASSCNEAYKIVHPPIVIDL